MLYDKFRLRPTPRACSECPLCDTPLVAKCGHVNTWHWAHKKTNDCDAARKGETEWHREWKTRFLEETREIPVKNKIVDVRTDKYYLEFQSGSLPVEELVDREFVYGSKLVWILRGADFKLNVNLRKKAESIYTFRWKYPRKIWFHSRATIFFDDVFENGDMLYIKKIYPEVPCGGWGKRVTKEKFIKAVS